MSYRLSPTYRYFGLAGMVALNQGTTDTPTNIEGVQNKLTVVPYYWGYGGGGFPNFTGNIRGINITSTVLAGGVAVTQFTNT